MAVSVMNTTLNGGTRPQFSGVLSENGLRQIEYHQNHCVEKFPLLWSDMRLADALEMNLFLEHRYRGLFRVPCRAGGGRLLGGVSITRSLFALYKLSVNKPALERVGSIQFGEKMSAFPLI